MNTVSLVLFLVMAAVAWFLGSWPALLLLLLTRGLQDRTVAAGRELLLFGIPAFWLLLQWTLEDRRLFFPWSMGLATCAMTSGTGRRQVRRLWCAAIVASVFLVIRVEQGALPRVLLIETLAAVGILSVAAVLHAGRPGRLFADAMVVATASILACFSLAI
ncbi:MAG: hypothetical protein ACKO2P_13310 [Planctomycetota bacterium]